MTRNGMTPEQAVFGKSLRWFNAATQDDNDTMLAALGSDGEAWLAAQIRATARIALISGDACQKVRQAMMRRAPMVVGDLPPGSRVYFWQPHSFKGRNRSDPTRWRGPATVVARESHNKWYIGWRARCLLVARENLRNATMEECAAAEQISKEATLTADQRNFEDTTTQAAPANRSSGSQDGGPTIPKARPNPGEQVYERRDLNTKKYVLTRPGGPPLENIVRREVYDLRTGKLMDRVSIPIGDAVDKEAELCDDLPDGVRDTLTRLYHRVPRVPEGVVDLQNPRSSEAEASAEQPQPAAVEEELDLLAIEDEGMVIPGPVEDAGARVAEESRLRLADLTPEERKRKVLDDVPLPMKKPRIQDVPVGVEQLPLAVMMCVAQANQDHWLEAKEVHAMSRLLGRNVTGVRVHTQPRRKLYEHRRHGENHRLSVMYTEKEPLKMNLKDDMANLERQSPVWPEPWRGLTVFYQAEVKNQTFYLDTPAGCVKMDLTPEDVDDVRQVYAQWNGSTVKLEDEAVREVYELVLKGNQKELDPRRFDDYEREKFRAADVKEWTQWVRNGSVRVATPAEEASVSKDKILSAPMRHVRTNQDKTAENLEAKSRVVLPGHLDPQLGAFRTDSPTTSWMAVVLVTLVGLCHDMEAEIFDVASAFLSGMELDREVYCRAPADGLPAVSGMKAIKPFQLLRILKGAFGLPEAPRLWYLRARQLLRKCGFVELRCVRAVFILRSEGRLIALLALHVDDGMLWGVRTSPIYKAARKKICELFDIKGWKQLADGEDVDYLGVQWNKTGSKVKVHMTTYINKLEEVSVTGKAGELLDKEHVAKGRRLLAQLRWPISHVVAEMSYEISRAAQKHFDQWTVEDLKALNKMVGKIRNIQQEGRAGFNIHKVDLSKMVAVTAFDANFGRQEGLKSQLGYVSFISCEAIEAEPCLCSVVEFGSSVIHRVVRRAAR